MDRADISVIMPIYNGEKYLEETLDNLLKQTFKNFEVICINDASTDATSNILEEFGKRDGRIRIFNNCERMGAAFARNRGIREASGKYIAFLDSDDIFEEEMLAIAYKTIEKYETDIVVYEILSVPSERIYEKRSIWRSSQFRKEYCTDSFAARQCQPDTLMDWMSSPCNKLYRKSFITENKLEFQSLQSANDVYFVNMALLLAKKMIMMDDHRVMVYARNHGDTTRISYNRDPMCAYQAMLKLGQELVDRGLFSEVFQHYYCLLFFIIKFALQNVKQVERAKRFYAFLQEEGMNQIKEINKDLYENQDAYIHTLLENFKYLDFDSVWWQYGTLFAYRLYRNADRALSIFRAYENDRKRIALWGAGINGKILLDFLHKHDLNVSEIVDKDEKKQGTTFGTYTIRKPEEIIRDVQAIVVCTWSVYQSVTENVRGMGMDVVCVEQILQED